jgi:exodeoxyribonuclease V gamma subunit
MLHLHYSNRTEALLQALVGRLEAARGGGRSPLAPVCVVVPNHNMQRYLELGIARATGVAANLTFHRLERFVGEWLEGCLPSVRVADRAWFETRVLATLLDDGALEAPELGPVRTYLRAGGEDPDAMDLRRVQLAVRLGGLFEEYAISRPRMVDAWREGRGVAPGRVHADAEGWQRDLFVRCLESRAGQRILPLHRAVLEAAAADPSAGAAAADAEVHVFGMSYAGPVFHWALAALGRTRAVQVYALNPCMEFWEDVPSAGELRARLPRRADRRARAADAEALEEHPALAEGDTPALVLWGRPGREHVHLLDELTGCDFHPLFDEPEGPSPTLLEQVQGDILTRAPERAQPDPAFDFTRDRSIQVLACHGVRREVEAVADAIWRLVRDGEGGGGRPLRFNDIAVLVNGPDRDLYMPHIRAVFDEAHRIPHTVRDLPLASASRIVEAATLLLDLPLGRLSRPEVLDVITHPAVRGRVPEVEAGAWAELTSRLGIFHGLDHADHAGTYIERDVLNWDQGVRRLVLGAFMTGEASGDTRAFVPDSEGASTGVAGAAYFPEEHEEAGDLTYALLVRSLLEDVRFARDARLTLEAWARFMSALVSRYLIPSHDAEEADLRRCLSALASLAERDLGERTVSYRVAAELARQAIGGLGGGRGEYLAQGVAVSTLVPMRAVPFRAVFVLGLSEGRFPAAEGRDTLDLRTARRQVGDVSPTERDEYAFLEALLSARETLVLSYVARDELTGDVIAPSPVVERLLDVLERGYVSGVRNRLQRTPPLRRFEADKAFAEVTPCFAEARVEARARALGDQWRAHHGATEGMRADASRAVALTALAEELGDAWEPVRALLRVPGRVAAPQIEPAAEGQVDTLVVPVAQLRGFLECPLQGWARSVAGIGEDEDDGADLVEDEPFVPASLDETLALRHVFVASLREGRPTDALYRDQVARLEARGRWPTGALAVRRAEIHAQILDAWRGWLQQMDIAPEPPPVRVRFGPDREHGDADRVLPPLTFTMDDPRPGRSGQVRVEITGRTEPVLGAPRASLLLVPRELSGSGVHRTRRLRHALRAFFDHLLLSHTEGEGPHRAAVVDVAPEGKGDAPIRRPLALAPVAPDRARAWLEARVRDLYGGPHVYFMPCEAILQRASSFATMDAPTLAASIEHVRNPFNKAFGGGMSRFGPVPDAVERPAPPPEEALAMARARFGLFFELLDLEGWR